MAELPPSGVDATAEFSPPTQDEEKNDHAQAHSMPGGSGDYGDYYHSGEAQAAAGAPVQPSPVKLDAQDDDRSDVSTDTEEQRNARVALPGAAPPPEAPPPAAPLPAPPAAPPLPAAPAPASSSSLPCSSVHRRDAGTENRMCGCVDVCGWTCAYLLLPCSSVHRRDAGTEDRMCGWVDACRWTCAGGTWTYAWRRAWRDLDLCVKGPYNVVGWPA